MTLAGLIFLLVTAGVVVAAPGRLIELLIVSSVFAAAAVLNASSFPLTPYYLTTLVIAMKAINTRLDGDAVLGLRGDSGRAVAWVLGFALVGAATAAVCPRLFAGTPVYVPREGISENGIGPLQPSLSNLGQVVYVVLNAVTAWYAGAAFRDAAGRASVVRAIEWSGVIVLALGAYQFVSHFTGLPFPSDLLYSNEHQTMQYGKEIGSLPRITSTFTETAGASVFLLSFLAFVGVRLASGRGNKRLNRLLLVGCLAVLLLTTSSTAYLGMCVLLPLMGFVFVVLPVIRGQRRATSLIGVGVLGVLLVGAVMVSGELRDVINDALFNKQDSSSYADRSGADRYSLVLLKTTIGLGVGLGSHRPSSFLMCLLGTVGVAGVLCFSMAIYRLLRAKADDAAAADDMRAVKWALGVQIGALCISGPDPSAPGLWALVTAAVACTAARQATPAAAPLPAPRPVPAAAPAAARGGRFGMGRGPVRVVLKVGGHASTN